MKDHSGSAFPCSTVDFGNGPENPSGFGMGGMTMRDYFAGQALAGEMATWTENHPEAQAVKVAYRCYAMADAMLAERFKEAQG
jgi:hypothetical protein